MCVINVFGRRQSGSQDVVRLAGSGFKYTSPEHTSMSVSREDVKGAVDDLSKLTGKTYSLKWPMPGFGEVRFDYSGGDLLASGSPKELWGTLVALLTHERKK